MHITHQEGLEHEEQRQREQVEKARRRGIRRLIATCLVLVFSVQLCLADYLPQDDEREALFFVTDAHWLVIQALLTLWAAILIIWIRPRSFWPAVIIGAVDCWARIFWLTEGVLLIAHATDPENATAIAIMSGAVSTGALTLLAIAWSFGAIASGPERAPLSRGAPAFVV